MRTRVTIGAGIALGLAMMACGGDPATEGTDTTAAMGAAVESAAAAVTPGSGGTRVADIVGNPDQFIGQTVTVEADVEEVLSGYAFSLDEDSPMAGGVDNDLMVFSPKAAQLANIDDQWLNNRVRVTGVVRRMTVAEIEREIEWDLDAKTEGELKANEPVLIARTVERVGGAR